MHPADEDTDDANTFHLDHGVTVRVLALSMSQS